MTVIRETDQIAAGLAAHYDWLRALYRHFHRHPELSMAEHATAERIEQELTAVGLSPMRVGGTGVVVVIKNGPGTTVLARVDTDVEPQRYRDAAARGAVAKEVPANHSPHFAPLEDPTLLTAARAQAVAALAFLGRS